MKNFEYEISSFNPNSATDQENEIFTQSCRHFFDCREDFKYLSYTGIPYTEGQYNSWRASFDPEEKEYLVVKDGSKIIALSIIMKDSLEKFEILGLVVDPQYRRKGIAFHLLEAAEKRARGLGYRAVSLQVFCDNQPMLVNVIKYGFKPVKIDYHKRYDGEDILTLMKYL